MFSCQAKHQRITDSPYFLWFDDIYDPLRVLALIALSNLLKYDLFCQSELSPLALSSSSRISAIMQILQCVCGGWSFSSPDLPLQDFLYKQNILFSSCERLSLYRKHVALHHIYSVVLMVLTLFSRQIQNHYPLP